MEKEEKMELKRLTNNIRSLAIDMINEAQSGHPGIALGAAPIISTLYANHINVVPQNDKWLGRDRFVLSAGHGSSLLYSTLFMAGFDLSIDDLKSFRKLDSVTPGHPEYGATKGVDITTGPLGSGFASSVGMCIAEKYLKSIFGSNIFNYYTYVLAGDGDLMEGASYEAASLAGFLKLNNLIVLYDSNDVTLDGKLNTSFNENIKTRFESMGWNYLFVQDGEDEEEIDKMIIEAKQSDKPVIIEIKTIIGRYSVNEGTEKVHGSPLSEEDILNIKNILGVREGAFNVSQEVRDYLINKINLRTLPIYEKYNENLVLLDEEKKRDFKLLVDFKLPIKISNIFYDYPVDGKEMARSVSGKVLNFIAKDYPFLIGGSADVSKSTFARINDTDNFSSNTPLGRNINFGIRECAMGFIANGLALSSLTPFVSTFFSFSDYLKPAIRLAAIMNLPVIYVFSHDSISVGEDGATHEPVEQLAMLRATPNLDVYRPYDANEVIGAYKAILENRKPAAIVLGRNKVTIDDETRSSEINKGAYILKKEINKLEGIIISTGEEVELAIEVYKSLTEKGYGIRLVSMPSMERFDNMDDEYKNEILPNVKTFVIEASSSISWYKYVKNADYLFTLDTFGASGKKDDVLRKYGFVKERLEKEIETFLK